jgi:hypothetical protein
MKAIGAKLLKIQQEIGTIDMDDVNPFYSSKFVNVNTLLKTLNPILNKHGVLLTQPLSTTEGGKPAIETILLDVDSGEVISGVSIYPEINDSQKTGAAQTYHRRYGILSILGLGCEDKDGNETSPSAKKKAPVRKKVATKTQDIPF